VGANQRKIFSEFEAGKKNQAKNILLKYRSTKQGEDMNVRMRVILFFTVMHLR
jgi:hypothetical protein